MRADHARVDPDGPLRTVVSVAPGPQPIQDQLPRAIS
jgi:hypothetical protein